MKRIQHQLFFFATIVWFLSGCGAYRTSSITARDAASLPPQASSIAHGSPEQNTSPPPNEEPVTAGIVDAQGAVAVEIIPQYNRLQQNVKGELSVLLKLDGKKVAAVDRQPIQLAIIIDRSGSMTGDKVASVKIAALELLKRLTPEDRVTLISYSDTVTVHSTQLLMDEVGKTVIRDKILGIQAGGGTALGPATIEAEKILTEQVNSYNGMSHILLLSDGLANVGVSDPTLLGKVCSDGFAKGVSISTLGVGLDYNEDLMTKMADEGGGQYHYVRDDKLIATVLEDELKGLMATVARDIQLRLLPAAGFAVQKVYGYSFHTEEGFTLIKVGSLRSGQNRDVLITLTHNELSVGQPHMGEVIVEFSDVLSGNSASSISFRPQLHKAESQQEYIESENSEVTVRLAEVRSFEELSLAAQAVDRGDFTQAETMLSQSISELEVQAQKTPDEKLTMQIKELRQAKSDLEMAKTSSVEKKHFVKKKKSSAYQQSKQSKGRKSTFDKLPAKKKSRRGSKASTGKKTDNVFSY
ncbi:MAG: VWA domain-containing protein [Deltaproteobacteria bacterium]|nr:VWA domain-containing protein [Deltaproteobacteria bacterium]MBN2673147.1 VWA domain-containing protein [Deltaproteobacteria bacterium]